MRLLTMWLCVGAAVSQGMAGRYSAPTAPEPATGPAALLARAWPFYDFENAAMKPWHLKASYVVYDSNEAHAQAGVYEYWWASPDRWRSTWRRAGMSHTDWHLANGQLAYLSTGEPLSLFEYKLEGALVAPLPKARDLDPAHFRVEPMRKGGAGCLSVLPLDAGGGPEAASPTYCFDREAPVLRSMSLFEHLVTRFARVRATQGKYLARSVVMRDGSHELLSATVDLVQPINAADAALEPPASALRTEVFVSRDVSLKDVEVDQKESRGMLKKRVEPEYPREAKKAGIEGTVVLEAMIGTDGRIHDLRVVSAPAASLAAASFGAVSQWEYRPYVMGGRAVPVETTVTVTFSLKQ